MAIFGFLMLVQPWILKRRKAKVDELFLNRHALTEVDFYKTYFSALGVNQGVAIGVRQVVSEIFEADMSRLQADDDFKQKLSYFLQSDSVADVNLILALEEKFSIKISDAEAGEILTIRDLVLLVNAKTQSVS